MKTAAVFFPFDLFGSSGTATGVDLLADELTEILEDNSRETVVTRARSYSPHVRMRECEFATLEEYAAWRETGRSLAKAALRESFCLWFSGNHLGVLPVYDELSDQEDTLIVQLDAHLDIHHFDDCHTTLSHGNFLLHVAGPVPPLVNIGNRDLLLPAEYIGKTFRRAVSMSEMVTNPGYLEEVQGMLEQATRVYFDLDCDVFDPTYFPGVGRAVPFGLSPREVLEIVERLWSPKVRGMFVSEFDPGRDREDRSLATLVWLIERVLLKRYEER
jgi:arginase family enzyme